MRYLEGWSERELARRLRRCRASVRWLDAACKKSIRGPRPNDRQGRCGPAVSPFACHHTGRLKYSIHDLFF